MPSPYPGMDPYLEGSEWLSVHIELSSAIARQLAPKLRPKYIVRTMRRFVAEAIEDVSITTRSVYPDVGVAEAKSRYASETEERGTTRPAPRVATQMPESVPVVPVPLQEPDPDAVLDLQNAFQTTYDDCGYDLSVDYSQTPEVPFSEQMSAQSAGILQGDENEQ